MRRIVCDDKIHQTIWEGIATYAATGNLWPGQLLSGSCRSEAACAARKLIVEWLHAGYIQRLRPDAAIEIMDGDPIGEWRRISRPTIAAILGLDQSTVTCILHRGAEPAKPGRKPRSKNTEHDPSPAEIAAATNALREARMTA